MKILTQLLLALALILPAPALAEFSSSEKDEIKKIGNARNEIAHVFKAAGQAIEARATDGTRASFHAALARTFSAHYGCFLAWGHILNSPGVSGYFPDRATRIQDAFGSLDSCRLNLSTAMSLWTGLGETAVAARLLSADSLLASFNRALPYTEWQPASFPASIGPHDDWYTAQRHLHRFGQYGLGHTISNGISFFGAASSVPTACNRSLRFFLQDAQEVTSRHIRGWALFSGIVFHDRWNSNEDNDALALQALVAASQGQRPPQFFEVALGSQYLWGKAANVPTISGASPKVGVNKSLFGLGTNMANFTECVLSDVEARGQAALTDGDTLLARTLFAELRSHFSQASKGVTASAQPGRVKEFLVDFGDGWNDHDNPAMSVLNFFHSPPAGPPAPGGLSCGPGTHQEGSQCLPDPSPLCPVFAASWVPLNSVTAEARCVEVLQ